MLQKLWRHITEGNRYQTLEIQGGDQYVLTSYLREKGVLEKQQVSRGDDLQTILGAVKPIVPLFLTLHTDNVLKKAIPADHGASPEALVSAAFPNLDLNNFNYQILRSGKMAVVCIAKNELIKDQIDRLRTMKIEPFGIALGVAELGSLATLIEGEVAGSGFRAQFEHGVLTQFELASTEWNTSYDLGGMILDHDQLPGFAQLLGHLYGQRPLTNLGAINMGLAKSFVNKRTFHFGLRVAVGFFLVLLLTNFFVFDHYHSANQELRAQLQQGSVQDRTLQRLREEVRFKEDRLQRLSKGRNSRASQRLDEIGQGVPASVSLDHIAYGPLAFPLAKEKPIHLDAQAITITGVSHDNSAFALWSDHLESMDWIEQVEIIDYTYRSRTSAGFILKLVRHEDR